MIPTYQSVLSDFANIDLDIFSPTITRTKRGRKPKPKTSSP